MRTLGRNRNTHDTATVTSYTLNSSTATVISVADPERMAFHVANDNGQFDVYVRMYAASQDNVKHGILLSKSKGASNHYDMPTDNIYTGEISAIASAGNPVIMVTEW